MDRSSPGFRMVSSILIGAAGGVFMAAVLLFLFQMTGYEVSSLSFCLIAVVAVSLPWCMSWIGKRGIFIFPAQFVMSAVSLLISLLYMHESAANTVARYDMARAFLIVHALALLGTLIRFLIRPKEAS